MSEARTSKDFYFTVHLHRYHTDNLSRTGERIEVIIRIPEEAAEILFGSGLLPEMVSSKVCRRASRVARQTVGMPEAPWAIEAISVTEITMPSDLPEAAGFRDADGSEGWVYSVKSGVPIPPPALIVEPSANRVSKSERFDRAFDYPAIRQRLGEAFLNLMVRRWLD